MVLASDTLQKVIILSGYLDTVVVTGLNRPLAYTQRFAGKQRFRYDAGRTRGSDAVVGTKH